MKSKIFLFAIFVFLSAETVFGQFVITNYFTPRVGERERYYDADTLNIFPGNPGANQTWNFSGITFLNDSTYENYVLPSSTPYSSTYPTATIAAFNPVYSNYSYFVATSTTFDYLGNHGSTYYSIYSVPIRYAQYTQSYLQSFTNTYKGQSFSGSTLNQKTSGTMMITYDAYGTLTLPSGTVSNVGRIKYARNEIDTMIIGTNTIVETVLDTTWYWFKSNYRYGLLVINKGWVSVSGGPYTGYKSVTYVPNINSVGINIPTNEIPTTYKLEQNFPNPFNPSTTIRYQLPENSNVTIKIYDGLGKEIETIWNSRQNAGIYEISWDASKYSSGVYYCKLTAGDFSSAKQLVLVK